MAYTQQERDMKYPFGLVSIIQIIPLPLAEFAFRIWVVLAPELDHSPHHGAVVPPSLTYIFPSYSLRGSAQGCYCLPIGCGCPLNHVLTFLGYMAASFSLVVRQVLQPPALKKQN